MSRPSPPSEPLPFFVYGTLQRGEVRAGMWPRPPREVRDAEARAALYDLGPYPALGEGGDRVAGELWLLAEEDFPATAAALDEIECCGKDEVDLYQRRIVECLASDGARVRAYAYFLADPAGLLPSQRVPPGPDGLCRWKRGPHWRLK